MLSLCRLLIQGAAKLDVLLGDGGPLSLVWWPIKVICWSAEAFWLNAYLRANLQSEWHRDGAACLSLLQLVEQGQGHAAPPFHSPPVTAPNGQQQHEVGRMQRGFLSLALENAIAIPLPFFSECFKHFPLWILASKAAKQLGQQPALVSSSSSQLEGACSGCRPLSVQLLLQDSRRFNLKHASGTLEHCQVVASCQLPGRQSTHSPVPSSLSSSSFSPHPRR